MGGTEDPRVDEVELVQPQRARHRVGRVEQHVRQFRGWRRLILVEPDLGEPVGRWDVVSFRGEVVADVQRGVRGLVLPHVHLLVPAARIQLASAYVMSYARLMEVKA